MSLQPQSALIQNASEGNFEEQVLINSSEQPVLVNYWAETDCDCEHQNQRLESLVNEYDGRFKLVNLNTDNFNKLARQYGVHRKPTLKLFINGVVVETLEGNQDESRLQLMLARQLPRPSDKEMTEAIRLYQQGEKAQSLDLLAQALSEDPQNIRLILTMARLQIAESQPAKALEVLDNVPDELQLDIEVVTLRGQVKLIIAVGDTNAAELQQELKNNPDDIQSRYQLAALCALNNEYVEALEGFIDVLNRDRHYADGAANEAIVLLFSILGEEHSLVQEYRPRLKSL